MARRDPFTGTVRKDAEQVEFVKPPEPRSKATYDLPKQIIGAVNSIAKDENVSRSDVVAWALAELIGAHKAGNVDWTEQRDPAFTNPRAKWKLRLPDIGGKP